MPLFLVTWLQSLSDAQAKEVWDYLDGKPGIEEELKIIPLTQGGAF